MITITDSSPTTIIYDNGFDAPFGINKFTIRMIVDEPYLYLRYEANNKKAVLTINYSDVSSPASGSASALKTTIKGFIDSGFSSGGSPLTMKGDLFTFDTADTRLQVGTDGRVLIADSSEPTGLKWQDPSAISTAPLNHAASHVNGTDDIQLASAAQKGLLSAADWSAFNAKQNALGYTPEDVANKQSDLTASATKYPTVDAVNAGLATKQNTLGFTPENVSNKSTDTALGTSDTLYPSQRAVKLYVDGLRILKRSTSDTVTTSTTLTTINNLSHSIAANEVWYFEASGSVRSSSTNGARLGIAIPTGATVYYEMTAANSSTGTIVSNSGSFTNSSEIAQTFDIVANTVLWWRIIGVIANGSNSGTFAIQGKTTNIANTVTFQTGGRLILFKG